MKNRIALLLCFVMTYEPLCAMSLSPRGSRRRADQAGKILRNCYELKMGLKKLSESWDLDSRSAVNKFVDKYPPASLPDLIVVTEALNNLKNSGDAFDAVRIRSITELRDKENTNPLAKSI